MANNRRLSLLASLLKGYDTVLDIGTDHGFVLREALDLGYIKKGIAADIGEKPLQKAKNNLIGYPVEFILSNGFEHVNLSYDAVVIAGMGVYTISEILKQNHESKTYFLQPNDKYDSLRMYLMEHGFKIIDEYVIYDKFYYVIMKVIKENMDLSEEDIYVGPVLKTKKEAKPYFLHMIHQYEKIMEVCDEKSKLKFGKIIKYYKKYV